MLGYTQEDLGTRIGLTAQQIHKYEIGANRVSASKLFEIATVTGLPVSAFFEGLPKIAEADAASEAKSRLLMDKDVLELAQSFSGIEEPRLRRVVLSIIRAATDAEKREE